ncbi:hypothetical protein U1280_07190 [Enterococcus cecorum]|nr:hypothetical protein [Enterococcus cecorum]MDZ5582438.1 hypothetical protein [Enterococcus cecorum]MDZ5593023.1 hypothetical protein [Enterococcus cecorum]
MNEKDLFKGINLLKEECERSGNSIVLNVWHKQSDLEMTVLCGSNKEVTYSILSILLHADEEAVVEALKNYKTVKVAKDILNQGND